MPRYRQTDAPWLRAACAAGAYLVVVATLFTLQVGASVSLPTALAIAAPPLGYAALSTVIVPQAPLAGRIAWVGRACLAHAILGLLAAVEIMWAGALTWATAVAQVFVLYAPAPVLTLLATSMVLTVVGAPARRPAPRAESGLPRPAAVPSAQRPMRSFARPAAVHRHETDPGSTAPAAFMPLSPPVAVRAPAPPAADRPPVHVDPPAAAPMTDRPSMPAPAAPDPPAPAAPTREARPAVARKAGVGDDAMVRVSFERVAAQLPAEAFVLPFDRLGESLKEPHTLLVPRRIVLAQMREGGISIDWPTIAAQFPELALGMSQADFRYRYPDLKLSLPVDEVLAQLPPDTVPLASAVLSAERAQDPPPVPPPGGTFARRGAGPAAPAAPPVVVAPPAAAAPPVVAAADRPVEPVDRETVDRETVSRIVACFSGAGTFEAAVGHAGSVPLVRLVAPGLADEAVAACAGRLLRFLPAEAGELVTVRTTRAVVVLAGGTPAVVAAARRPGPPVALLELRAARAGVAAGGVGVPPAGAGRALRPVSVDGRVAGAGRALASFGAVEPAVFADGDARVYVFSAPGRDALPLGRLALAACDALDDVGGDLGRLVSVVLRRGGERTLVRPLAGGAAVLAATGPVTRPGRVHRDAERAATVLEAL